MYTIIQILKEGTLFYISLSHEDSAEEDTPESVENVETFITQNFENHVSIENISRETLTSPETGSLLAGNCICIVTLRPKTDGIMQDIAERLGLQIIEN